MTDVALTVAEFLKSEALFAFSEAVGYDWGDRAVETEIISPLVFQGDAEAECIRQMLFMEGPLVEDVVQVTGARRDLMGKVITITGDRLGYDAGGKLAFVIGYIEGKGITDLSVVRKLS